jgi:hypothetical protein
MFFEYAERDCRIALRNLVKPIHRPIELGSQLRPSELGDRAVVMVAVLDETIASATQ